MSIADRISTLQKALEAAPPRPTSLPPATLKIEAIDVSGWDDFATIGGGTFFDKPEIKSTIYQSGAPQNMVLDCSFFSVISSDKQAAINTLRRDLLFIKNLWPRVKVVGFLSKPSLLELKTPAKPDEMADDVVYVDLRGPIPAKRKWAAFCFLFAYEDSFWDYAGKGGYKSITVDGWKKMGLPSAVREGEVGHEVPANDQLFTAVAPVWSAQTQEYAPVDDSVEIDVSDLEPQLASKELEFAPEPYREQQLTTLTAQGETKAAKVIGALHPEIQTAADKHGIDLGARPGRELQEMRKYFGAGSGLYFSTVDFQTARVSSTLLTLEAQKRIYKALNDNPKPKRKRPVKRVAKRSKPQRKTTRR